VGWKMVTKAQQLVKSDGPTLGWTIVGQDLKVIDRMSPIPSETGCSARNGSAHL
jgi:hypothetical protein